MTTDRIAEHTPGPWFVSREVWSGGPIMKSGGCFSITDNADRSQANVICSRFPWEEKAHELEANADLIAAAPTLLAAAECAANVLTLLSAEVAALGLRAENVPTKLRAAIAAARGQK